jgi:uncharacterized protein
VHLSKIERQSLINQYRVLEKLDTQEADYYKRMITILEKGYENHYAEIFRYLDDPVSSDLTNEVLDILSMFRDLQHSCNGLPDKSGILEQSIALSGFDADSESGYLNYARYLVEADSQLMGLASGVYDSHMPRLDNYRQMLARYRQVRNLQPSELLSQKAILEIIG